jgi:hypothetical protein
MGRTLQAMNMGQGHAGKEFGPSPGSPPPGCPPSPLNGPLPLNGGRLFPFSLSFPGGSLFHCMAFEEAKKSLASILLALMTILDICYIRAKQGAQMESDTGMGA